MSHSAATTVERRPARRSLASSPCKQTPTGERLRDANAEDLLTIPFSYRILGICALLRDLDGESFTQSLRKSSLARMHLMQQRSAQAPLPHHVLAISKDTGFIAALAAGDIDTETRIAEHSPRAVIDGAEYEEDFLFYHFQQRMLSTPTNQAELQGIIDRWTRVEEGEATAYITICQALLEQNAASFCSALDAVLEMHKEQLRRYGKQADFDRELAATEGKVYLNGLALVRLAQSLKLAVPERPELIPRRAHEASCPPLPEDAWLRP
ncbi:immunity 49 family protein [Comamonas sp. JC664]|uniref:immunity 49 family protein n=1 Tax=Comamonas sp. JC664 TaxID=2801917 RepID=UPI00174BA7CC|nr:immunity 49 family protein [Comamonas sp. JC664]MBL0699211.1 immunity 49 family protein [Comamonas sp. JC664]